jgi:hypothetical protein
MIQAVLPLAVLPALAQGGHFRERPPHRHAITATARPRMPLPAAHVAAVARLGCPRHDCREDAEAGLIGDGEAAIPAVRWALATTRDAEVRARCGAILAATPD